MTSEELSAVLSQLDNTIRDLQCADRQSFSRHIKKFSKLLHSPELQDITSALSEDIDIAAWLEDAKATEDGKVGSATLELPDDQITALGYIALLIDRFANDPAAAVDFAYTFSYVGNSLTQNLQNMTTQFLVPFARDYINHIKFKTGLAEATMLPIASVAPARKAFVIHGHDEGAKASVARFLEQLDFEVIILHEQASTGLTVIEKIEAHSDVGFAVVLLTPDDEGNAKGQKTQPRARQNVILELGYFLGKLTRRRVMALQKGDLEIPSDFRGVVYVQYGTDGGWKRELAKELQAAGFTIDLTKFMRS